MTGSATAARRLSRTATFAAVVAIMVLFQAASSALTPLFVVYQRLWGFSSATVTLVFAVFVLGMLAALLTLGAVSDQLGRRPVLVGALAVEAVALVIFLGAASVGALLVARAVQGIATGVVLPTLGAMLVDTAPPHAQGRASVASGVVPIGGLALGALVCGVLAQYAPDPTRLVWALLLAATVVAALAALTFAETAPRRTDVRLLPRLGVPRHLRGAVAALVPVIVASWALGGLYLALGPSVVAVVFGVTDHFVGGLVVTLLCGVGAVTAFGLAAGTAVTLLGTTTGSMAAAIAGTAVAGVGYGASGLATFGAIATLARPLAAGERSGLFAVAYVVAYLSFSLPALAAGCLATVVGLRATVLGYAAAVIVVAFGAALAGERRYR